MMKTIVVSMPRKPRGLMNLEGKTNFQPRNIVLSSLSQAHLRRSIIGSRMPFFFLVCAANSRFSIKVVVGYDIVTRVHFEPDSREGPESEVESWPRHGHSGAQKVLAPMTRALQPVLVAGRVIARVYN